MKGDRGLDYLPHTIAETGNFAMNQRLALVLALLLGLWVFPAAAQTPASSSSSVYEVTDVSVDVTSDSAAKARDQAIAEAQRTAFGQLLERLGADASIGAKLSNDDLSTLVQNFEVRNERTSSVRYIGVFAVQFRPIAVKNFLMSRNATYDDSQGKPVLVIPVVKNGDKVILWDEPTRWQQLWNNAAKDTGLVPVIIPSGFPEDKSLLTAADVAAGKVEAVKALMNKYQADSAVVATLNGTPDDPAAGFTIDIQQFGSAYDDGSDVEHITLRGSGDRNAVDGILESGIGQIRRKIEKDAKQEAKDAPLTPTEPQDSSSISSALPPMLGSQTQADGKPVNRLPVSVQFLTLAQWTDIQRRLQATPGVRGVDINSVDREETDIDLGFTGTPEDLQIALAQHGLRLTQDTLSGQWILRGL